MDAVKVNALEGLCLEALDHISNNLPALMDEVGAFDLDFTSSIFYSAAAPAKLEVDLFAGGRFADRLIMWGKVCDGDSGKPQVRLHTEVGEWGADLAAGMADEFWHYVNFGDK